MIRDVVAWHTNEEGCNRCPRHASHYVRPFFARAYRVCPLCARELERFFDNVGWPEASDGTGQGPIIGT